MPRQVEPLRDGRADRHRGHRRRLLVGLAKPEWIDWCAYSFGAAQQKLGRFDLGRLPQASWQPMGSVQRAATPLLRELTWEEADAETADFVRTLSAVDRIRMVVALTARSLRRNRT